MSFTKDWGEPPTPPEAVQRPELERIARNGFSSDAELARYALYLESQNAALEAKVKELEQVRDVVKYEERERAVKILEAYPMSHTDLVSRSDLIERVAFSVRHKAAIKENL